MQEKKGGKWRVTPLLQASVQQKSVTLLLMELEGLHFFKFLLVRPFLYIPYLCHPVFIEVRLMANEDNGAFICFHGAL